MTSNGPALWLLDTWSTPFASRIYIVFLFWNRLKIMEILKYLFSYILYPSQDLLIYCKPWPCACFSRVQRKGSSLHHPRPTSAPVAPVAPRTSPRGYDEWLEICDSKTFGAKSLNTFKMGSNMIKWIKLRYLLIDIVSWFLELDFVSCTR